MAKRFTFADAKEKIKSLEAELALAKEDLTNKDGVVSKKTHLITLAIVAIAAFVGGLLY